MLTALALAAIVLLFDAQNGFAFISRWRVRAGGARSLDYTLVVPVYGHRRYFEDRQHLAPYRENVLVALDMAGTGMSALADELEAEGWAVHRTRLPVPGPPRLVLDAIAAGAVTTTYAFRLDADTYPIDDPAPFVARMIEGSVDYASVRVHVHAPRTVVEKIQAVEYRMAMRSRRLRPWLSSGACFGGTVTALRRVLEMHSMWFPGEDLESGRIAQAMRMKVKHLDMRVETAAPDSWTALLKQRRSWWAGGFRHAVINVDKNVLHTPVWALYITGLVVAGFFFKAAPLVGASSLVTVGRSFAILLVVYTALTIVTNWSVRSPWMLVYAPYALVQALGMPTAGAFYWSRRAIEQRHWGRYRFGYRRGVDTRPTSMPVDVDHAFAKKSPATPVQA